MSGPSRARDDDGGSPGALGLGRSGAGRLPEHSLLQTAVLRFCRQARRIPRVRGRDRALLGLLGYAGLATHGSIVRAALWRPVIYQADLDLGSWIQRLAFVAGGYEWDLPPFLRRLWTCHPSAGALLDVGANVGLIAVPAALLLRRERRQKPVVYALEPVADNCAALERNIALNQLEQEIRVLRVGAGNADLSAWIHVEDGLGAGEGSGTANILPAEAGAGPDGNSISVRAIDSLRSDGAIDGPCAVLKLDTDGYDLKALQGAAEMLRTERPFVFGEFDAHSLGWHGQSARDVRDLATESGYEVYARRRKGLRFGALREEQHQQDLLLAPRELKPSVAWCIESSA